MEDDMRLLDEHDPLLPGQGPQNFGGASCLGVLMDRGERPHCDAQRRITSGTARPVLEVRVREGQRLLIVAAVVVQASQYDRGVRARAGRS